MRFTPKLFLLWVACQLGVSLAWFAIFKPSKAASQQEASKSAAAQGLFIEQHTTIANGASLYRVWDSKHGVACYVTVGPSSGSSSGVSCLKPLSDDKEHYGLELIRRSNGVLIRGLVYVVLQRMEDELLVSSREEENTPSYINIKRRVYRITSVGKRALEEGGKR